MTYTVVNVNVYIYTIAGCGRRPEEEAEGRSGSGFCGSGREDFGMPALWATRPRKPPSMLPMGVMNETVADGSSAGSRAWEVPDGAVQSSVVVGAIAAMNRVKSGVRERGVAGPRSTHVSQGG